MIICIRRDLILGKKESQNSRQCEQNGHSCTEDSHCCSGNCVDDGGALGSTCGSYWAGFERTNNNRLLKTVINVNQYNTLMK